MPITDASVCSAWIAGRLWRAPAQHLDVEALGVELEVGPLEAQPLLQTGSTSSSVRTATVSVWLGTFSPS